MRRQPFSRQPFQFTNEDLLRGALFALFRRIPWIHNCTLSHGSVEAGKDLWFSIRTGIGSDITCSCVVKNAPLNSRATGSESSMLAIINQITMSFGKPIVTDSGLSRTIDKVFVVTPYAIPEHSKLMLNELLSSHLHRVEFVGGSRLYDLFKEYWPDFVSDEYALLCEVLKIQSGAVKTEPALQYIAFLNNLPEVTHSLSQYYVKPAFTEEAILPRVTPDPTSLVFSDFSPLLIETRRKGPRGKDKIEYAPALPFQYSISNAEFQRFALDSRRVVTELRSFSEYRILDKMRLKAVSDALGQIENLIRAGRSRLEDDGEDLVLTPEQSEFVDDRLDQFADAIELVEDDLDQLIRKLAPTFNRVNSEPLKVLATRHFSTMRRLAEHARTRSCLMLDVAGGKRANVELPHTLLDVLPGSLLITGAAGYGKTSFCKWHWLEDSEAFMAGTQNIVPIYVPLSTLATEKWDRFDRLFLQNAGTCPPSDPPSFGCRLSTTRCTWTGLTKSRALISDLLLASF